MGLRLLGDQDDAASVAVEPMHDSRPVGAVDGTQVGEAETKGVGQGAAPVALGGVNDHVARLVDEGEEFVLIQHIKGDIFGKGGGMGRLGRFDVDVVAGPNPVAGLGGGAIYRDLAGFDALLNLRSAQIGELDDDVGVKTSAMSLAAGGELEDFGG